MAHTHEIQDSDKLFTIDPITRAITNPSGNKTVLIQGDHNSEIFTIAVPKVIEDHDMSDCNKIRIHYINIGSGGSNADIYEVPSEDIYIEEIEIEDEETVEEMLACRWLISRNATTYAGSLSFLVEYLCTTPGEDLPDYAWHSAVFSGIRISDGMDNSGAVIEEHSDILMRWYNEFIGLIESTANSKVESYIENTAKPEITAFAEETVTAKVEASLGEYAKTTDLTGGVITVKKASQATMASTDQNGDIIHTTYAKVSKLTDGSVTVAKATNAVNATKATNAVNAVKAAQDADGNVIPTTYAKKSDLTGGVIKVGKSIISDSATKATQDADGNVIPTTYAKKSDLTSGAIRVAKAEDAIRAESAVEADKAKTATNADVASTAVSSDFADLAIKAGDVSALYHHSISVDLKLYSPNDYTVSVGWLTVNFSITSPRETLDPLAVVTRLMFINKNVVYLYNGVITLDNEGGKTSYPLHHYTYVGPVDGSHSSIQASHLYGVGAPYIIENTFETPTITTIQLY